MSKSVNIRKLLINEIALEGLDGITLQSKYFYYNLFSENINISLFSYNLQHYGFEYPKQLKQNYPFSKL